MNTSSSQGCTAGAPVARNGSWTCDPKVNEIFADTSRNGTPGTCVIAGYEVGTGGRLSRPTGEILVLHLADMVARAALSGSGNLTLTSIVSPGKTVAVSAADGDTYTFDIQSASLTKTS